MVPRKDLTITDVKLLGNKMMRKPAWAPEVRKKSLLSKARNYRRELEDIEDHGEIVSGELAKRIENEMRRVAKVWRKVKK